MRRFELHRDVDTSGVSGTGVVAQGIQFSTGDCAVGWLTAVRSVGIYRSIEDVQAIHGHSGATRIVWVDPVNDQAVDVHPTREEAIAAAMAASEEGDEVAVHQVHCTYGGTREDGSAALCICTPIVHVVRKGAA